MPQGDKNLLVLRGTPRPTSVFVGIDQILGGVSGAVDRGVGLARLSRKRRRAKRSRDLDQQKKVANVAGAGTNSTLNYMIGGTSSSSSSFWC